LCGYSFGRIVAFPVAVEDPRIKAVAGIAPFIQPENLLHQYTRPKFLGCGTQDVFVNSGALEKMVQEMPEPQELALYPGVDHFWGGKKSRWPKESRSFSGNVLGG
jgi:alpha/beta superfamily hydrolase